MLICHFLNYALAASAGTEVGIVVDSMETEEVMAVSYDVTVEINEYGELLVRVRV